jgi:riboflavin synthase
MFTGIIEEKGAVAEVSAAGRLKVKATRVLEDTSVGDSIAVMGVCLTVVELDEDAFTVDVMPETLRSSTLGDLRPGSPVNLERAMSAGARFGGHMVNGHVDGVGMVSTLRRESNAVVVAVAAPAGLTRYMVPKGSVALDGISLTLVEVSEGRFTVSVIPHTLDETALSEARPGTRVNIEVDIMAKYVEVFLARYGGEGRGGIEQALSRGGFIAPGQEI